MAELYHVRAEKVSGKQIWLDVYIVHADESEFYEKKNFALQLIWQPANPLLGKDSPLGDAIDVDHALDPAWMVSHASDFISTVKIESTANYPVPKDIDFSKPMQNLEKLPKARFFIEVTDSRWLEHLSDGRQWKSAAYDMEG